MYLCFFKDNVYVGLLVLLFVVFHLDFLPLCEDLGGHPVQAIARLQRY
jgi:hypothetical protein